MGLLALASTSGSTTSLGAPVPTTPNKTYKHDGWEGWGHWLGTGNQCTQAQQFLPYGEALAVSQSLGLANQKEWKAWGKEGMRPANVPCNPDRTYKHDGWQGWGHWLGTGNVQAGTQQFLPFEEALTVAQSLGLANGKEWKAWCKNGMHPLNVPAHPEDIYKHDGWQGWGHWLGNGNRDVYKCTKAFLPFPEALAIARSLRLASSKEWRVWSKEGMRPANVPSHPDATYKHDGWQGWGHWLGTGNIQAGAQ